MDNHIIITGAGRAGTTFLVRLLNSLGLDTGLDEGKLRFSETTKCGLELDVRRDDAPYVCKSPKFCNYVNEVLSRDDIHIEYILLPFRELFAAAESRRYVNKEYGGDAYGGLWGTDEPQLQEDVLLQKMYKLMYEVSASNVPVILMNFPKIVLDGSYLYEKLKPVLKDISSDIFKSIFDDIAHPEWVHDFSMTRKED